MKEKKGKTEGERRGSAVASSVCQPTCVKVISEETEEKDEWRGRCHTDG